MLTHTGVVDVTEDHSLLNDKAEKVSPKEVKVGDQLLHCSPPVFTGPSAEIDEDTAYAWGLFLAEGSCGLYESKSGKHAKWAIVNADVSVFERAILGLSRSEKCTFKVYDTMKSSAVYSLTALSGGRTGYATTMVKRWRALFYDAHGFKKVPDEILCASRPVRQAFWDGYYVGDGDQDAHGYTRCDIKGKIGAAGLFVLARSLGYDVSLNTRNDKLLIYRLTCCTGESRRKRQRKDPFAIKKLSPLPSTSEAWVYDLETENHHFAAGVGSLQVHNTDSVMCKFPVKATANGRRLAFLFGCYSAAIISDLMPGTMALDMEKIYYPYCLMKKKRYFGLKWLKPDDLAPSKDIKGIESVRRDYIQLFRKLIQDIVDAALTKGYTTAWAIFEKFKADVLERKFPMKELVQSKSVKANYSNKNQVQLVIANQMEEDIKGSRPKPGDRVYYIVGDPGSSKDQRFKRVLSWARVEKYLAEGKIPPGFRSLVDFGYYLEHYLKSAFIAIFGIWLEGGGAAGKARAQRIFNAFAGEAETLLSGGSTFFSSGLAQRVVHTPQADGTFARPDLQVAPTVQRFDNMMKNMNKTVPLPDRPRKGKRPRCPSSAPSKSQQQSNAKRQQTQSTLTAFVGASTNRVIDPALVRKRRNPFEEDQPSRKKHG